MVAKSRLVAWKLGDIANGFNVCSNVDESAWVRHMAAVESRIDSNILLSFSSLTWLLCIMAWCLRWRPNRKVCVGRQKIGGRGLIDGWWIGWDSRSDTIDSDHMIREGAIRTYECQTGVCEESAYQTVFDYWRAGHNENRRQAQARFTQLRWAPSCYITGRVILHHTGDSRESLACALRWYRMNLIPQRYWVPRERSLVKQFIHRCLTCVRWRAVTSRSLMGDLPAARVTPARLFATAGVDNVGPIHLETTEQKLESV